MKKKLLLCCALFMLCFVHVSAQTKWYVVTDNNQSVAVNDVLYMLFVDDSKEFTIMNNDGSTIVGVKEVSFTDNKPVGVEVLKSEDFDVTIFPNPVVSVLKLTGLRENATAKIYSLGGALVVEKVLSAENTDIDVAHLPAGMYVLTVNKTSVKFVKK